VLVGEVNPSGKLPLTFPKSDNDLPRVAIQPAPSLTQSQANTDPMSPGGPLDNYVVHYDEGAAVGYKWFEMQQKQPLFAFGFGLSYTTYAYSALAVDSAGKTAHFTVKNTGRRPGTEIAEVYVRLPKGSDEPFKRLAGWARVNLAPGESKAVAVPINDRTLKTFDEEKNAWNLAPGEYQVLVGNSSVDTPLAGNLVVR
jgi:beta-glucosidase